LEKPENHYMKKIYQTAIAVAFMILGSCNNNSDTTVQRDSVTGPSPDSAANNGILPPSAAPGNAGNSSLADTAYKASDTTKGEK
jgi:hypothetical protein